MRVARPAYLRRAPRHRFDHGGDPLALVGREERTLARTAEPLDAGDAAVDEEVEKGADHVKIDVAVGLERRDVRADDAALSGLVGHEVIQLCADGSSAGASSGGDTPLILGVGRPSRPSILASRSRTSIRCCMMSFNSCRVS